jgi:hypothetical protein
MHYTGMAAVRVTVDRAAPVPGGPEVFSFLFPVFRDRPTRACRPDHGRDAGF